MLAVFVLPLTFGLLLRKRTSSKINEMTPDSSIIDMALKVIHYLHPSAIIISCLVPLKRLKKPKVIILDEATSALDSSTEAEVQEAFQKLRSGRTLFVVAHRLSTIIDADLILFVKDGDIVERGTHQELLERKGEYFELWERQNRQTEQE